MAEIIFQRTPLPDKVFCGMCTNYEFCCGSTIISDSLSNECRFTPSQFKPREGFKHNDTCYFFSPENRYGPCICCYSGEFSFNCIGCRSYVNHDTAHKILKNYINERNGNNNE